MAFINRKMGQEIRKFTNRREIIVIRGPRQAGKTTLMKMLEKEMNGEFDKVFVNMDLPEYRRALEENPLDFVKRFKKEKKLLLFLDEIQRCRQVGSNLKIIYDEFPQVKLIISGSSSLEIKNDILPFLVGRAFIFELQTFDFAEFLLAKDAGLSKIVEEKQQSLKDLMESRGGLQSPSFTNELISLFKEYAVFGGYPAVVLAPKEEEKLKIIRSIRDLYLEKDIVTFFKIEESSKFEDFSKALSFQTSNILNVSNLAGNAKISFNKAEDFIEILKHTYIIKLIRPFYKNLTTEIRKSPKMYFLDFGLRNSLVSNFLNWESRDDKGKLVENFVFKELLINFPDYEIRYWRTTGKAEVDFVLIKGKEIIPVEVKIDGSKLGKSFYSFIETYQPKIALVATLDQFESTVIGKTKVYFVPLFYF